LKPTPQRIIGLSVAAVLLLIPIIVMIWSVQIGALLLIAGAFAAYRAIIYSGRTDWSNMGDVDLIAYGRQQSGKSQTILVQLVDDYGRDLSPNKVQQLMDEAYAKAGPRDMVVGVRYKINKKSGPQ